MRRKTIVIIVILTTFSLLGIVFTQLYWVRKSMNLKEEQFDNGVRIAMRSVLNQLMERKNDNTFQQRLVELSCIKERLEVTDIIEPAFLDSLMMTELGSMELGDKFYYGLFNDNEEKRFLAGSYSGHEEQLVTSPFRFSVSSVFRPGNYFLSIYYPYKRSILLRQMEIWLLVSVFFILVLIYSFAHVILTFLRQKKLSEMKNDFINNLTHEFKTPIATTNLAAEMLTRPEISDNGKKIHKYARVILDENQKLQNQVEQVLKMATLEKQDYRFKFRKISMHELVRGIVKDMGLRMKDQGVKLKVDLSATNDSLNVDQSHMAGAIYNLLDNAIKYSPVNPVILIQSWNNGHGFFLRIKDNGVGIDPSEHKNVFKNLYRVSTGNIHDVRGFGLGLYYAITVINVHKGRIILDSELGKGSTFDVYLPFKGQ